MTQDNRRNDYILGSSDAEHERLIRQAVRLAPITENFFREAGIDNGQRVLDLGSGVGDVAMLVARLVGPSGEVTAIERDARSVCRARVRAAEAGLPNVRFVETDIDHSSSDSLFDAAVGRYILQFLPDPVGTLRSLSMKVRPGGIIAFQEPCFTAFLALSAHLPLWSTGASLLHQLSLRFGVNTEMGPSLHNAFQDAGLPVPHMRLAMELSADPEFTRLLSDAIGSVRPQFERFNLSLEPLGDLDTLRERLQTEVASSNTVVPWIPLVGAWCRIPVN
jgi:ubiquinone/menaquinone biosynthesis C-methylase UbiE